MNAVTSLRTSLLRRQVRAGGAEAAATARDLRFLEQVVPERGLGVEAE